MRRVQGLSRSAPLYFSTAYRLLSCLLSPHGLQILREERAVAVRVEADAEEEGGGVLVAVPRLFEALVADGRAVEARGLFAELEREAERDALADEVAAAEAYDGE